jgi:hypothetical protein
LVELTTSDWSRPTSSTQDLALDHRNVGVYCVVPEASHCFLLSQSSSQMRSLPLLRVIEYRYVGDGVGAKVVVPSNSRNASETPDSGENAVDMVFAASVEPRQGQFAGLGGESLEQLGANRRMKPPANAGLVNCKLRRSTSALYMYTTQSPVAPRRAVESN